MSLIERREATSSDLKWFGVIVAGCFAVLGTFAWLRDHPRLATTLWSTGAALMLLYYAVGPIQRLMFSMWMAITYPIGWTVTHLTMALMYYGVFTPIGLLMRLVGRDPMQRAFDRAAESYWEPHDPGSDPKRYFRQF